MITLYMFGQNVGLPDASPFVTRTMIQPKMAGLEFRTKSGLAGDRAAPKVKLPYLDDGGTIVADSDFIRAHIERKSGFDVDAGLDARQRAVAQAVEMMLEEGNTGSGPSTAGSSRTIGRSPGRPLIGAMPLPTRVLVLLIARRSVRSNLSGQATGSHSGGEIRAPGPRNLRVLSDILGDRTDLTGETICGADAKVLAALMGATVPLFRSLVGNVVRSLPELFAYRERLPPRFF